MPSDDWIKKGNWMKKYTGYLKEVEGNVMVGGKHVPYKDSGGNWTIGYGKLISKDKLGEGSIVKVKKYGKTMETWQGKNATSWDEKQAEESLRKEATSSLRYAEIYAKEKGFNWESIPERQKHGLADFMYNLGPTKMNTGSFKNTMRMYLKGDDVVSKGFHKRYVETGKGPVELKGRNKKWKELFGGMGEDIAMGKMLKEDDPLGVNYG